MLLHTIVMSVMLLCAIMDKLHVIAHNCYACYAVCVKFALRPFSQHNSHKGLRCVTSYVYVLLLASLTMLKYMNKFIIITQWKQNFRGHVTEEKGIKEEKTDKEKITQHMKREQQYIKTEIKQAQNRNQG